ncbi:MAG: DUF362 domain-containing protein [Deltaproteobacteria bacterium]|nr:DUF362 domain-containing protein [Deltaproteobacteria bacterium]MBN2672866.1 DUF362 domain-containing protein [Deltaproteobacteria bacterium]
MKKFILSESPFLCTPSPEVYVAAQNGPYHNTIDALSQIDLSAVRGKTVLLKPNAGRLAGPESGICTNPQVVAAAIDVFREAGGIVSVGESPITGVNTMEAFEITGIAAVARERNCPLIDMDERKFVPISLDGTAIQSLKLCPEVMEFDLIVSIAVMKTHMHTGVTLGVKNMKGCLWRRSKVVLHMLEAIDGYDDKPLDIAIADMSGILRPHFTIIDGTVGMEGIGPSAGVPKPLDVVVVGADAFAADAVACALMGKHAANIPHLRIGNERGYGEIDIDRISVFPSNWRDFAKFFEDPPTDISIGFPEFGILDENSCSACQSSLLLFLKRYGDVILDYLPKDTRYHFAIGKGHEEVPEHTYCIGNCTRKFKNLGQFIKGCPPVGSEILRFITGSPYVDEKDAKGE